MDTTKSVEKMIVMKRLGYGKRKKEKITEESYEIVTSLNL